MKSVKFEKKVIGEDLFEWARQKSEAFFADLQIKDPVRLKFDFVLILS